jgi:hypothetical protein
VPLLACPAVPSFVAIHTAGQASSGTPQHAIDRTVGQILLLTFYSRQNLCKS